MLMTLAVVVVVVVVVVASVVVVIVGCRLSTVMVDVEICRWCLSIVVVNVDGRRRVVNVIGRENREITTHLSLVMSLLRCLLFVVDVDVVVVVVVVSVATG